MNYRRYSKDSFAVASRGPEETFAFGEALGELVYPGLLILLKGSLGMGKTKLIQGIGRAMGCERIKSPTFIIMSEHEGPLPLLHADLYRLEDEAEIDQLGIEEYLEDGYVAAVEWAERWRGAPEEGRIDVEFDILPESGESRLLTFTCRGAAPRRAFDALAERIKSMRAAEGAK